MSVTARLFASVRGRVLLSAVLALVATAAVFHVVRPAEGAVAQGVVFQRNTHGYACMRIPAIVRSDRGTLLAFVEGRKGDCGDTGNIDIILKRSFDGGATWEATPRVVVAGNGSTRHNPVPVVLPDGRILLLSTHDYKTVYVQTSANDGASWSTPREITSSVKLPAWAGMVTGPSHAIVLSRGPHAGRRIVAGATYRASSTVKGGALIYSDDAGATWHLGAHSHEAAPGLQVQELSVFERPDGGLYALARNEKGTSSAQTAFAVSTDSGESFIGRFTGVAGLVVPTVQASTLEVRATDQGSSYNRVLLAAPSHATERRVMTIRSSFDGGRTWQTAAEGKVIYGERAAYSDLVAINDQRFGLLYEGDSGTSPYAAIRFARFTEADLDAPDNAKSLTRVQDSATLRTSDPAQRHVFAVASSGQLTHWFEVESTWELKRGVWGSAAVTGEVVSYLHGREQHAFARGRDGSLQHRWWDPAANALRSDTWVPAGSLAGSPTGFSTGAALHVFARGSDGSLRHWWRGDSQQSQLWAPAATLAGDPVAFRYGDQQHVFAAGTNGALLHWWWQSGAPVRQESWGGSAVGTVTGFVHKGQVHAFARNSAGRLAHWFREPGETTVKRQTWSAGAPLRGRPISVVHGDQQHVFARDTNNALAHWWWDPGTGLQHAVWPGALHSDPVARVIGDQQHVYGAAADGQLTHWWWDRDAGIQRRNWGGDVATG